MPAEIFYLRNFMKIVIYLILILMVLISAFVIICVPTPIGAGFSMLRTLAIYGA